jgi:hypothetical protein
VSPKSQDFEELHDVTTQKSVTAVRTSNLTKIFLYFVLSCDFLQLRRFF